MNRHQNIWVLYGGYGNLGDEAIFLGTLSVFKNVNGIEKVKLIDIYPEMPKKLNSFSVEYVNTGMLLGSREKRALRYSYAPFQLALLHVCKRAGLKGLLWHRGSSGYDSYHGSRLLVESAISASAIASRFLYRVLGGLSMGFTRNGLERKILQKFLNIWDFVLLREPYSLYYVRDLVPSKNKVLVVHDFAIHVDRSETEQSRRVKDTVKHLGKGSLTGVILRDYYYQYYYPKWYRVKYLRFIKDLANALAKREHKVILIPFSYLGDRENDIRFYWELKAERIVDDDVRILSEVINLTPSEVIDVLSVFNYIISVRTH
ncbi:MAG: polysaccharide pyruvyl transferase family protein [Ignisphaera sp.]